MIGNSLDRIDFQKKKQYRQTDRRTDGRTDGWTTADFSYFIFVEITVNILQYIRGKNRTREGEKSPSIGYYSTPKHIPLGNGL